MSKTITKELIIALLVILAAILIVGVILYDFMPNNKIVPEEITYTTSQEVKEQLNAIGGVSPEEILMTYSLDQTDLDNYQITNDYRPGKTNPFSTYVTQKTEENGNNNTGSSSSTGSSGSKTTTGSTGSNTPVKPGEVNPGNYTNDKGLK